MGKLVLFYILLIYYSQHLFGQSSFGCELTKYSTHCSFQNNKVIQTDTFIFLVNNRTGESFTDFSIRYSKNENISNINGWIENMNGTKIRSLQNNEIKKTSASSNSTLYSDEYYKYFQLKHNQYPYLVYYTYTRTQTEYFSIADWTPVYSTKVPTHEAFLYISIPKNTSINSYLREVRLINTDSTENSIVYTYASNYEKLINKDEIFSMQWQDFLPKAIIAPTNFSYGIDGSAMSWESLGNWYYKLNNNLLKLTQEDEFIIKDLIKGLIDTTEIIRTLYHYLQDHTRYIEVTMGVGGYKAFPASYVSNNKYGDCKALSNYMKALLYFAGIKSYFVLINRDVQPEQFIEQLPYPQFNHVILAVPLNHDTIWIENTGNNAPFRSIGSDIQNRKALLIDENNSRLINMPSYKKEDCTVTRKIQIKFNAYGDAQANIVFSYKGYYFDLFNSLNTEYNRDEKDLAVKQYMPFENYDVLNWQLIKKDRDTSRIELASELNLYKLLKPLGDESYISIFPVISLNVEPPAIRTLPLQIPYPLNNIDSVIYSIPTGYEVKSVPEDKNLTSQFGKYTAAYRYDASKIIVIKSIEFVQGVYQIDIYKDFYGFYNAIKEAEKNKIVLKKKTI